MGEIKRFFYCFLLFLGLLCRFMPVQAQEAGATKWYDLPFAKVRMLSCLDGIQGSHMIVGGLQVKLKENWQLQKPAFQSLDEKIPLWIEYPVRPHATETKTYFGTIFFPVVGLADLTGGNFTYGLRGDLTACSMDNQCLTLPIQIELPLAKQVGNYTGYCAYIMDQMNQVPLQFSGQVQAQKISDHQAKFLFSGISKIHQAFLQNDQGLDFQILKREFLENGVMLEVTFPKILQENEKQNWILITNQGIFRIPVVLKNRVLPDEPKSMPWGKFIFSGFLLFFFSPFYIFWGLLWQKNKKSESSILTQMAQKSTYCILLLIVGGLLWNSSALGLFSNPIWMWGMIVILSVCLIVPPVKSWMLIGAFFLYPKPYLEEGFLHLNERPTWYIVWGIFALFWIWMLLYFKFKVFDSLGKLIRLCLKQHFFLTNLFFLMPTLFLLGWQIYALHLSDIPFENKITQGVHVVCGGTACQSWQNVRSYPITFISKNSRLGKSLLKHYHHSSQLVFLISPPEMTVFQESLSPKELGQFLTEWQNYHALGRPVNPPTHFGDDRHAPLPNAK